MKIFKIMTAIFALALVASIATLTLAPRPGPVSADAGGPKADVTFTKWITGCNPSCAPGVIANMAGVVGGDVGTGTFAGEIISKIDNGTLTAIHATYDVNGGKHSLTADIQVIVTDATGTAVITGVVTNGWLHGSQVTGGYQTLIPSCDIPTPGNVFGPQGKCFEGTLHLGPKF